MNIVLGLTGSIAAYKSADLTRKLKTHGADVIVVMTHGSKEFITPLTMQALSGHEVHDSLLDPNMEAGMGHIQLARWADIILIAPASAHVIAKLAVAMADDLLSTLCLVTQAKIMLAPAMNAQMWRHQAVQRNIDSLKKDGAMILAPRHGEMACGEVGYGPMMEIEDIVTEVLKEHKAADKLKGD